MVVDTMVFAYALLNVPQFRDESVAVLGSADEVYVPDSFHAELANVVWQWVTKGHVTLQTGIDVLHDAEALVSRSYMSRGLWDQGLALSVEHNHPVYDTLFIALALATDTRVITYDDKLLQRFPEETVTPLQYLAGE